ncbi:MAG: hypothetical protein KAY22_25725, partial [Rhizorhabdus sp.]|nr:hypothetical protein [Rhizorhabdus sp.]
YMLRKAPGAIENAYIHRFLRSDREELHDHPWDNQSIVLRGAYVEKWEHPALGLIQSPRLAGEIVSRGPEAVHSIYSVEPGTISLFTTGPKVREWGFITADGWIHNTKFRAWKSAREAA